MMSFDLGGIELGNDRNLDSVSFDRMREEIVKQDARGGFITLSVLTAQVRQNFQWGIINWENIVTYQNSSNSEVLPLPDLNIWSNLFLKFKIARVLSVELGGCVTYFTKYYAPDYVPQLSQFAVQQNAASRMELGGYPWVDVYANMHLKRARFFIAYSHVNGGSGNKNYFLTPHYPTNGRIMHMGVSWNFYN